LIDANMNTMILRNKGDRDPKDPKIPKTILTPPRDCIWIHTDNENGGSGIDIRDQSGAAIITLNADKNAIVLSNKPTRDPNDPKTIKKAPTECIWIHADAENGGSGIHLRNQSAADTIILDGDKGDIILVNADCAEDFEIIPGDQVEPGAVMAINDAGQLSQCTVPYDKRVAGVIAGAGDFRPGLVLGRTIKCANRAPISLIGKVLCKADANYASIEVGDLLTTSATVGHAMKATDPMKSFGAVLGKALQPLKSGCNLIPILVSLQ
jgi:hypothetical protein